MASFLARYLPTLLLGATSIANALSILSSNNETAGGVFKRYNSNNWCGPVNRGSNIVSVEGTWTVPHSFLPQGGSVNDLYQFYQWVGIDGMSDCGALLQGGTGQTIEYGQVSYYTWFEFWPSPPVYGHVQVVPGDTIYVRVDAESRGRGRIFFENLSNGQRYTETVTSPGPLLCFETAEWIGEDAGSPPEPFPAFTTYDFTGCRAATASGELISLNGAEDWIVYKEGERLCHPQRIGDFETSIIYG